MRSVVVLIASTPREEFLKTISLPSIAAQTHQPAAVVLVADQRPICLSDRQRLQTLLGNIPLVCLQNAYLPGAAGSWNTGIDYIATHFAKVYIAILDDDDNWEPTHLSLCLAHSENGEADIVLSGIHVVKAGIIVATNIPASLCVDDFLVGNPGWQGSNTFISGELAAAVGGFTNGLASCNDRDFAIRVLELRPQVTYTSRATVSWQINHSSDALSAVRSPQKLLGVSQFYHKHRHRMSEIQKEMFFNRIERLFLWSKAEIEDEVRSFHVAHSSIGQNGQCHSNPAQSKDYSNCLD
ncbi:glycosyltransferase [Nitrincola nitratireducens]|uniref:Putative glycosyl transferase n=1 Tax=Nitrincola nitratireducens TaxID=1229521 RepID=W9V6L5_9GAMM|nr:glycosyltransferase [Nitrincola nitratireducens]EXJ11742.1 putative glycosyl transferase [Nitrincola nitratireducens]